MPFVLILIAAALAAGSGLPGLWAGRRSAWGKRAAAGTAAGSFDLWPCAMELAGAGLLTLIFLLAALFGFGLWICVLGLSLLPDSRRHCCADAADGDASPAYCPVV